MLMYDADETMTVSWTFPGDNKINYPIQSGYRSYLLLYLPPDARGVGPSTAKPFAVEEIFSGRRAEFDTVEEVMAYLEQQLEQVEC